MYSLVWMGVILYVIGFFTKGEEMEEQIKKHVETIPYKTIVATIVICAGVFGSFYKYTMDNKNSEIALLERRVEVFSEIGSVPEAVKKLEIQVYELRQSLKSVSVVTHLDLITGKMTFGAISSPTVLTQHRINAIQYINDKKYDLALLEIKQLDNIYPSFTGSLYLRFLINKEKGLHEEAAKYAGQLLQNMPTDNRILDVYVFMIEYSLAQNNRKEAEDIALTAVNIWSDNQKLLESFEKLFGYTPTIQ